MRWLILAGAVFAASTVNVAGQPLPEAVRSAGVTVEEHNEEVETIRALARARGADARNALGRLFAERSWSAIERGDYPLAARYALAGRRASPPNTDQYRAALGALLFSAGESRPLVGHSGYVRLARFSPDGARLVTASDDGTARVWDAATSAQLGVLTMGAAVTHVAYSPDGTRIVTVSADRNVTIWSGSTFLRTASLPLHPLAVSDIAFSPDGSRIATACLDGVVRVWDALSGAETFILSAHQGNALIVAFSPDGLTLLTAGQNRTVRLWRASDGAPQTTIAEHYFAPGGARFSPNGQHLLTTTYDLAVHLLEVSTGREFAIMRGHESRVLASAFSPDGSRVATASQDGTVRVWDAGTGHPIWTLRGHTSWVTSVAYSPDGQTIATTSIDRSIRLWDASTGSTLAVLRGHSSSVAEAEFNPAGTQLVSASADGTARLWEARAPGLMATLRTQDQASDVTFAPDGAHLAVVSGIVNLWDPARPAVLAEFGRSLRRAQFSADGTRLLATGEGRRIGVWDVRDPSSVVQLSEHHGRGFPIIGFDPQSTLLATAAGDGSVRIWDGHGPETLSTLQTLPSRTAHAAFSDNGSRVAVASGNEASVYSVAGVQGATFSGHQREITDITFGADGASVATAARDGTARLWDAGTGRQTAIFPRHEGEVLSVSVSPNGASVATASSDQTAHIWDVATGHEVARLRGHRGIVWRASFSPDGTRVATASSDRSARVWDVARAVGGLEQLASIACNNLLLGPGRRFSDLEIAADPLIREVWLRGGRADRDVCEGVQGAN